MPTEDCTLDLAETTESLVKFGAKHGIQPDAVCAGMGQLVNLARHHSNNLHAFEAAVQEGCAAMLLAMGRFDRNRGVPFSAYVPGYLRGAIIRAVKQEQPQASGGGESDEALTTLPAQAVEFMGGLDALAIAKAVDELISELPGRVGQVAHCVLRLGLTRAESARVIGVTRMAVTKIMRRVGTHARKRLFPRVLPEIAA